LRLRDAAFYVGVSESKFQQMVAGGLMPKPFKIGGVTLWDARKVDSAFDDLPGNIEDEESVWDNVHV
jgi:predicted DNA-binding transcriptional regulator AlpA